jgi:hypothetical protein
MWRIYTSDTATHIFFPAFKIQKGNRFILDTEYTPQKCKYFVIYDRGGGQEPIKFEVTDKSWTKLAELSKVA